MDERYNKLADQQHEVYRQLPTSTVEQRIKLLQQLEVIKLKMNQKSTNGGRRHWSETPAEELLETFRGRNANIPRGRFVQHTWRQDG
ncbi:MAG: hypothetical protein A2Z04_06710 [Chloroflexi bacterium RBG_16_57_9]|nr:MAG: hypothetical protein A2Z04_06710 [Chloroflexi bacterium RBG_16_57_9]